MTELTQPVLVIGVGGAGSKLASQTEKTLGFDCLQISNNSADFDSDCENVSISTQGVINPSSQLIRGCTTKASEEVSEKISNYSSVIIMANLAGKSGSAISPIVSQICKESGKSVISFAIMPFRFEKDRIFNSGISLKRLRTNSNCTVVIDNDAILSSNPDLSPSKCHEITNSAIMCIANSLKSSPLPDETSVVSTSKDTLDLETSLRDSLKMLYANASAESVKHSMLYVLGGEKVPVGMLNTITNLTSGVFNGESRVDFATESSEQSKVVMVSALQGETRFDSYDPLSIIPKEDTLDWDEPECSVDCKLDLPQLE